MILKNKHVLLIISVLCFIFYGNTLSNSYALDDTLVLTENKFTKKGMSGMEGIFAYDSFTGFFGEEKNLVAGGRYRPLSLASLAIETELFGLNPFISHLVNIIFYILTCFLFYLIMLSLLKESNKQWYRSVAFLSMIIFLVHPIHTEVVANIKGRDEMMTLLGALYAMWLVITYSENKNNLLKNTMLSLSGLSFFLALLSKENAITFLAITPAALFVFRDMSFKRILALMFPSLLATVLFLAIRHKVLGVSISDPVSELLNDPFLSASLADKYATIMYTLGLYLKLLVFPHPLTYDYYPYHIKIVPWSNIAVIISSVLYVLMAVYAVWGTIKKKTSGFAILLFLASLSIVSNLLFPIGTFMNERFLFISSLGFAICFALALVFVVGKFIEKPRFQLIVTSVLVLFIVSISCFKAVSRNKAWKDDLTLFTTDVTVSSGSAKSNCSAGGKLYEAAKDEPDSVKKLHMLDQSAFYLRRSVAIHPIYTDALLLLGNVLFEFEMFDSTIYYYKRIVKRAPYYDKVYENLPIVLSRIHDVDFKIDTYEYFDSIKQNDYNINYQLGVLWGKEKGNISRAISYLEKAYKINPARKEATKDLGVAYGFSGRLNEALAMFQAALKITPNDDQIYYNIGITLSNMGKTNEANTFFSKANDMKKNNKPLD